MFLLDLILALLVVIGSVGNVLTLIVFMRKRLKKLPLNLIFCIMAVSDTITLMVVMQKVKDYKLRDKSRFLCKVLTFLNYCFIPQKSKYKHIFNDNQSLFFINDK